VRDSIMIRKISDNIPHLFQCPITLKFRPELWVAGGNDLFPGAAAESRIIPYRSQIRITLEVETC
jgi:hypothetical protein